MHAVEADVDEVKIIPLLFFQQPVDNLPLLLAHAEDFFLQPSLCGGCGNCFTSTGYSPTSSLIFALNDAGCV